VIRLLGCAFALFLAAGEPAGAAAPAPTEELKALRAKLEALKKDIARGESSRNETTEALKAAETAISDANRKLTELSASKEEVDTNLASLRSQHGEVEKRLENQRALAARLVHQHYTAAPAGTLQALAAGQNPSELARTTTYLGYVAGARREILDALRRDGETLRSLEKETATRQAELNAIQQARITERKRLESERENRKQVLTKIAATINRQRQEAGVLAKDETRLTKLVEDLARMIAARKAKAAQTQRPPSTAAPETRNPSVPPAASGHSLFEQLKGRLQMPVRGELVGRYGSPRSDSGLSWAWVVHPGADRQGGQSRRPRTRRLRRLAARVRQPADTRPRGRLHESVREQRIADRSHRRSRAQWRYGCNRRCERREYCVRFIL
jgi:septal ring factor EnvC (AmiA/AmiB activator)